MKDTNAPNMTLPPPIKKTQDKIKKNKKKQKQKSGPLKKQKQIICANLTLRLCSGCLLPKEAAS